MKTLWKSLSNSKKIATLVLLGHFLFIFFLSIQHLLSNRITPKKPISIRVISPPPAIATTPIQKKAPSPKQKTQNTKQNKGKKAPLNTSSKQNTKHNTQKPTPSYDSTLLNELQKNLDALSSTPTTPTKSSPLSIPKSIEKKSLATIEQTTDTSYAESLVFYLQNSLELPELGEVKISLEISAGGSLRSCEILEAKSHKNADFLKKRLPELSFPCFNGTQAKTFTIVFRNVEIH